MLDVFTGHFPFPGSEPAHRSGGVPALHSLRYPFHLAEHCRTVLPKVSTQFFFKASIFSFLSFSLDLSERNKLVSYSKNKEIS